MNAKWLEKCITYRSTPHSFSLIRTVLNEKIKRQNHFIRNKNILYITENHDKKDYMLIEARSAHIYWAFWRKHLAKKVNFKGRV